MGRTPPSSRKGPSKRPLLFSSEDRKRLLEAQWLVKISFKPATSEAVKKELHAEALRLLRGEKRGNRKMMVWKGKIGNLTDQFRFQAIPVPGRST